MNSVIKRESVPLNKHGLYNGTLLEFLHYTRVQALDCIVVGTFSSFPRGKRRYTVSIVFGLGGNVFRSEKRAFPARISNRVLDSGAGRL